MVFINSVFVTTFSMHYFIKYDFPIFREIPWKKPGPTHHARWMSVLLYCPKMYAFSDQIEDYDPVMVKKLEEVLTFTSLIYSKYWMCLPKGRDAPVLDLQLFKDFVSLRDVMPAVAVAAEKVLRRHPWYLTEEACVFSLCSTLLSFSEEEEIALKILSFGRPAEFNPGKPGLPALDPDKCLADFVGENSWPVFSILSQDGSWLELPPQDWAKSLDYQKFEQYVATVKVVNDPAERAIKLCTDYIQHLTKSD